uniref:Maturase n=1 Tax=Colacium vesiculosum TaxID=102910 RepID=A0A0B5HD01_9EUGL|nr:maturase [Colacium vesiculosum]
MNSKIKSFNFETIMTPKFLFYAWIDLRNNKNYFFSINHKKSLRKSWFKTASSLISASKFSYKKSLNFNSLTFLKGKIIENAILIYVNLFLKIKNISLDSSLTECVRKLLQLTNFNYEIFYFSKLFLSKSLINADANYNYPSFQLDKNIQTTFSRRVLKNKKFIQKFKYNLNTYPNVHQVISVIKSWDKRINFFIAPKIVLFYKKINKNILRNIFLNKINDKKVWHEIEKMLQVNVIGISNEYIYTNTVTGMNTLSKFLLSLYLSQLDVYIKKLCNISNFKKFLCFRPYFLNMFYKRNLYTIKSYIPLKICNYFINFYNLKSIKTLKQNKFYFLYKKNYSKINFYFFFKHIYYVRYNENLAFGVIGSKNFSKFLNRKIQGFIRSNLHLDLFSYNLQYAFSESMFFLGFKISLFTLNFKKKNSFSNQLKTSRKYFSRITARIISWKKKLSSLAFNRFSFEFFGQVLSVIQSKSLNVSSMKDRRIWLYLFQLEALRCFQSGKLISSNDKLNLISDESFKKLKFLNFTSYKNFSFNFYVGKIRILLKNVIESFPSFIDKSVLPLDIEFLNLFTQYDKKFKFLSDTFYSTLLSDGNLESLNYLAHEKIVKSKLKKKFLTKNFFLNLYSRKIYSNSCISITCPISYMLLKFSILGFLDYKKKRPISHTKFIFHEDKEIIKLFGAFAYSLLNWFRCSDNFSKVKFLVEILRQSCFLTLCRKHNKRKTWAYSVYTPNLLINYSIYSQKSFFPTKKLLWSFKKFFLYTDIDFLCSANFFNDYQKHNM